MQTYTAKNWAGFYESLKTRYTVEERKLVDLVDPYKQWVIKENLKIINNTMSEYVNYLKVIGSDHGLRYLKYLEKELQIANKAQKNEIYKSRMELYNALYIEFKNFRLAP